ncbi:MAG: hypothetical protein H8E30_16395 [Alphaproteobacteria bacterium]|nr:hypothetical protein [Alphaproteobacteria bacterium]
MMKKLAIICVRGLLLTACVQTTLIKAGKQRVDDIYTVSPATEWNQINGLPTNTWTQDGLGLQELSFFGLIGDGDSLFPLPAGNSKKMPNFRADMRADDVMELLASSLGVVGVQSIETKGLRPFTFSGKRGFQFNFNYVTSRGAELRGEAFGAVIADKLHLITYVGHPEYYYDKSRQEVVQMIRTLKL